MNTMQRAPAAAPERATRPGSAVILASGLLLLLVQLLPGPRLWPVLPVMCLFIVAFFLGDLPAVHITLFIAALVILPLLHPLLRAWPLHLLAATALYFLVAISVTRLRRGLGWLRAGCLHPQVMHAVAATSLVSAGALYGWYRLLRPDLAVHLAHFPVMPSWLLPLAGLGFACGNAALEELAFRGIIMQAFESALGAGWPALGCQAALFGAMHFRQGFPNLGWGLVMTIVYGVLLGALRRQSQGMLAPWLAHVFADGAIFVILAAQL